MKNWPTRPTTDLSKEALFNILANRIDFTAVKMLDLFGGTGAHSWEFLSRGCDEVTYVDQFRGCIDFVHTHRTTLSFENKMTIYRKDVKKFLKKSPERYNYVFAGPPYGLGWMIELPDLVIENCLLQKDGLCVIEHNPGHDFNGHKFFSEKRNYGQTVFSFFNT